MCTDAWLADHTLILCMLHMYQVSYLIMHQFFLACSYILACTLHMPRSMTWACNDFRCLQLQTYIHSKVCMLSSSLWHTFSHTLCRQVEIVSDALLGHQVNYQNYYHVFIETLPTWHNIMCRYLGLCEYDPQSSLQLWLLEDRQPGAYTDLSFRLPALRPLYACLSPHPLRHIKDPVNFGRVRHLVSGMHWRYKCTTSCYLPC